MVEKHDERSSGACASFRFSRARCLQHLRRGDAALTACCPRTTRGVARVAVAQRDRLPTWIVATGEGVHHIGVRGP